MLGDDAVFDSVRTVPLSCGEAILRHECYLFDAFVRLPLFVTVISVERDGGSRSHVCNCRALAVGGRVTAPAFDSGERWRGIHMIV